jgi:SRSO17 transposase
MMVHLGVENPFRQGRLQVIDQPMGLQSGSRVGAGQQLVEHGVRDTRVFASRHRRAPLLRSCPTPHELPDSPAGTGGRSPAGWTRAPGGGSRQARTKGERLNDWAYRELADLQAREYNPARSALWTRGLLIRHSLCERELALFTT